MKFATADTINGILAVYDTLEEAQAALETLICDGQAANDEMADEYADAGKDVPQASDFYSIETIDA